MKKLTAGIFAGILTIVTVNAARADIATTNYVNQNVDAKVGALSGLETTAKNNTVAAINEVNTAAKAASTAATTAETNAKTYADGLNTAMDARVTANKDAIDVLNGDASVEGSVDYKITEATMDAISDVEAAKKDIEILKGNAEKVGSVDNKIKTAIDGLDGNVTGSGVVKTIKQENGVLTATLSAVAEADLDTALAGKINGKMNTTDYNTATTMAADGAYAKKANTVGANLTALDTQVEANADAISSANTKITANETAITKLNAAETVEGSVDYKIKQKIDTVNTAATALAGRVTANENAIGVLNGTGDGSVKKALADAKAYADTAESDAVAASKEYADGLNTAMDTRVTANATEITNITKAGGTIDAKITAAQQTLQGNIDGKANVNKDLANKLLTTDATTGQLKEATAANKPSDCGTNGITCMLVNDGTGFKWEKIVDTYAAN